MNELTKRAVIYCRVSTKEQVDEGSSLVSQEKICKEFALKHSYEIVATYIEQGESAKTMNRTQLRALMEFCALKKNRISAVIVYKIDRLSRNTDDYSQIRLLLKRHKVEIKSTSEQFENTPAGRFMENIIANVAQFDNDVRIERCIGGMRNAMQEEGRYVWRAPFGFANTKIGGKSNIAPNEKAAVVRNTFEAVAKGVSTANELRITMAREGLVDSKGKPLALGHYYRMLRNETYAGWIKKFGRKVRGTFEPIISDDLFHTVQLILKKKSQHISQYNVKHPDFPLRRFVFHCSGKKLTGCWSKGKQKLYPYYFFRAIPGMYRKNDIELKFAAFMDRFALKSNFQLAKLKHGIENHIIQKTVDKHKKVSQLSDLLQELQEKQSQLINKNIAGVLSDTVLKQQSQRLEDEISTVELQISQIAFTEFKKNEVFKLAQAFLLSPGTVWMNASPEVKWKLQVFEFPYGVEFDGTEFRTPKICSLFNIESGFDDPYYPRVHSRFLKTNTLEVGNIPIWQRDNHFPKPPPTKHYTDNPAWNQVANELADLADTLSRNDEKPSSAAVLTT